MFAGRLNNIITFRKATCVKVEGYWGEIAHIKPVLPAAFSNSRFEIAAAWQRLAAEQDGSQLAFVEWQADWKSSEVAHVQTHSVDPRSVLIISEDLPQKERKPKRSRGQLSSAAQESAATLRNMS